MESGYENKGTGSLHSEPTAQTGGNSLWKRRQHAGAITVRHIAGGESGVQSVTTLSQEQRPAGGEGTGVYRGGEPRCAGSS